MTKTFTEAEITIDTLEAHIRDSGLVPHPHEAQSDGIWMRSPKGLGFRISIIDDKKFIRFATYLPLNRHATIAQKHALVRRLNEGVFLPVFTLDQDEDLTVMYVLPYSTGLVGGNFVAVVNRFGSMLEYVVQTFNEDDLIDLGNPNQSTEIAAADGKLGLTSGALLH